MHISSSLLAYTFTNICTYLKSYKLHSYVSKTSFSFNQKPNLPAQGTNLAAPRKSTRSSNIWTSSLRNWEMVAILSQIYTDVVHALQQNLGIHEI